jgi:3-dehydroquinate dehydratase-2
MKKKTILVINGPNLNMLGLRDPGIYGTTTYCEFKDRVSRHIVGLGYKPIFFQSNCEGKIIDIIQRGKYNSLIINAGALSHYSYALRDALEIVTVPKLEVHMSDIYSREEWRRKSVLTEVCGGCFTGQGVNSYLQAIDKAHEMMKR